MKLFGRRFRWSEVPKRRRQMTYVGLFATSIASTMNYKFKECVEVVGNPAQIQNPNLLFWLRMVFGRARSRWFGSLSELHVPVALRSTLFQAYAWKYGANLDEVRYPLDSFMSFQEFFCRKLDESARPIADMPNGLVSPVDGTILSAGVLHEPEARLEQVKGATYSLPAFLGFDPVSTAAKDSSVCYVVFYLGMGDYHRFHSPCSFDVSSGRHFCGELLPLSPGFLQRIGDVFPGNERVLLSGRWRHGQMNLVAVGAANVGSIYLEFDPKLKTNRMRDICVHLGGDTSNKRYLEAIHLEPGAEVGGFRLGSAVALVFEAPAEEAKRLEWRAQVGERVKVGQPLFEAV